MINDIVVYKENPVDERGRLKKKELDIAPIEAKKNYYDTADIKYFTMPEIKTLTGDAENLFYRLIFLVLYETGARVSESVNIKFGDIEPDTLRVKVLTLKQRRKGQIYRYLKISDKLMSLLLQHRLKNNFSNEDYIFTNKSLNKRITIQGINFIVKKEVSRLLGNDYMKKAHPHTFRHSRAIHLLDSGMNIMLLKNFLGHSNISNTLIYLKYSNRDMAEAVDKANTAYL